MAMMISQPAPAPEKPVEEEQSAEDKEAAAALAAALAKYGDGATAMKAGDCEAALDLFGNHLETL